MSTERRGNALMNEVHNSHARDDLPLSGGEGAIPEKAISDKGEVR